MSAPIASFLTAVYNGDAHLVEALESALGQTEKNIEIVAVDDGSTDSSREILRKYSHKDPRLRVFVEPHRGLVGTRNRALEEARGKYISVLDQDDVAMADRVEKQVRFLEQHPDCVLVGGQVETIDRTGAGIRSVGERLTGQDLAGHLENGCFLIHSSVTFRRAEVVSAGGYDPLFMPADEYDLFVRLAKNYRIASLPEIVCRYRVHGGQTSVSRILRQYLSVMCIRATFRGASRAAIRMSMQGDERNFLPVLRELGYSDDEIVANLTNTFLHWAARLRSVGDFESASELLLQAEGYVKGMKCNSHYLAQVYSWDARVDLASHHYIKAAHSLLLAFASSPVDTVRYATAKLLASFSILFRNA